MSSHYWTAIGINGQEFQGHFDGNGKVIQGLSINELKTSRIFGLFGDVYAAGNGAGIKNLTVMGASIRANCVSNHYTGVVQNSRIHKNGYGGILAASVYGNHSNGKDVKPVIENCQVQGDIVCISDDDMSSNYARESDSGGVAGLSVVGGFSGSIQNGSVVESCLTSATASANLWNVGGFSGGAVYTGENDTQPKIENCAATGLVYSHAGDRCVPKSGAFIGHNVGIIQHCYAAGTVTVDDPENWPSGGFAGTNDLPTVNESEPCGTITNCAYYKWDNAISDVCTNVDPDSINNILPLGSRHDIIVYIHSSLGGHYGSSYSGIQTAKACKEGYTGDLVCQYDNQTIKVGTSYVLHDGLEEHQWDEGVVKVEPKDGKEGEVLYTCQVCDEIKTIKVSQWPLPSTTPMATPTATPTNKPTVTPTATPTNKQNTSPTVKPTVKPTTTPTAKTTANLVKKITAKQQEKNSQSLGKKASAGWKDGKFNVTWGSVKGASGYNIYATLCTKKLNEKALAKTVSGTKTSAQLSKIMRKAISGSKNYKVRIQAFQTINGKKVFLGTSKVYHIARWKNKHYTNAKKLVIPDKKITLKKGKTATCNVKAVKRDRKKKWLSKKHGAVLSYTVTNKNIATVTKNGKIRAKKAGTCVIYVNALNGICGKITVTVK